MLKNTKKSRVFLIGLYHGSSKPKDVNDFLKDFIDEMKLIKLHGITNQSIIIHATITGFICDAPARAFLKCIKCHSGFSSCERRVVFT